MAKDTVFFKNKELVSLFFGNKQVKQLFFGKKLVWSEEDSTETPTLIDRDTCAGEYSTKTDNTTGFILYAPTVTHSWSSMQGKNAKNVTYNMESAICLLSDKGSNIYHIDQWLYKDTSALSCIDAGETISGSEIYYLKSTYNSSSILNSWDGKFTAGKLYGITIIQTYDGSYDVVTGSKTTLVGATSPFYIWALGNTGEGQGYMDLKVSSHKMYGEISV